MPTSASPEQIRREFDSLARLESRREHLGPHEEWLLRQLPGPRRTVLEIGCGAGQLSRRLAAAFDRVTAIDFSEGMLAEARRDTPKDAPIDYHCADLFDWLRERDEVYDAIVSVSTLHHVDLALALRAMKQAVERCWISFRIHRH